MHYRLPPGSGSKAILGYTRHEWGAIHFYAAIALVALVALHVALHWAWVRNSVGALTRPRDQRKAGAGVGGAVLLLALGLAAAGSLATPWLLPIGEGSGQGHGGGGGEGKGHRGGRTDATPEAPAPQVEAKSGGDTERTDGGGQGGVKGSMSLAEAAAEAGVPVEHLAAELKLPAGVPAAETLGRLRRQHGFTMEDVRAAIARLKQAK